MIGIDVDTIAPAAKAEPPRDRLGRYLIPDAKGKPVAHTRATTVAKSLADNYNLEQWKMRQVAAGLARRPDLVGLAAAHDPDTDRKIYEEIVDGAMEASESASGRRDGTTLHRFTELVDLGLRQIDDIPDPYRARVGCYQSTLADAGVQIHTQWIEQIFIDDRYTIAGTADRIVTLADGRRVIADLKTGKDVKFGELEFAIQMAIYANHTATYNQDKDRRGQRVDVDRDTALVIHLPSKGTGCDLYLADLKVGYDALLTAMEVREWRKTKTLTPYRPLNGGTGGEKALGDWLRERIRALEGNGPAVAELIARWSPAVPKPLPEIPTADQVDAMADVLDRVEAAHQITFGPTRPGTTTPTASTKTRSK